MVGLLWSYKVRRQWFRVGPKLPLDLKLRVWCADCIWGSEFFVYYREERGRMGWKRVGAALNWQERFFGRTEELEFYEGDRALTLDRNSRAGNMQHSIYLLLCSQKTSLNRDCAMKECALYNLNTSMLLEFSRHSQSTVCPWTKQTHRGKKSSVLEHFDHISLYTPVLTHCNFDVNNW